MTELRLRVPQVANHGYICIDPMPRLGCYVRMSHSLFDCEYGRFKCRVPSSVGSTGRYRFSSFSTAHVITTWHHITTGCLCIYVRLEVRLITRTYVAHLTNTLSYHLLSFCNRANIIHVLRLAYVKWYWASPTQLSYNQGSTQSGVSLRGQPRSSIAGDFCLSPIDPSVKTLTPSL